MNSSGRISLVLVSVVTLLLTGLFLGATDAAGQDRAASANFFSNFTSFPTAGGPYIIGVTWDSTNSELRVIFNEDLDATTVTDAGGTYDFLPIGFTWDPANADAGRQPTTVTVENVPSATDQRVVTITGFGAGANAPAAGDSLALATFADFSVYIGVAGIVAGDWTNGISGQDGSLSTDHTRVPITTGPICVQATTSAAWFDGDSNNDVITLEFDDTIQAPGAAGLTTTSSAPPSGRRSARAGPHRRSQWPVPSVSATTS